MLTQYSRSPLFQSLLAEIKWYRRINKISPCHESTQTGFSVGLFGTFHIIEDLMSHVGLSLISIWTSLDRFHLHVWIFSLDKSDIEIKAQPKNVRCQGILKFVTFYLKRCVLL